MDSRHRKVPNIQCYQRQIVCNSRSSNNRIGNAKRNAFGLAFADVVPGAVSNGSILYELSNHQRRRLFIQRPGDLYQLL